MKIFRQCYARNRKNKRCKCLFKISKSIVELEDYNYNIVYYCINHTNNNYFSNVIYVIQDKHEIKYKKYLKSIRQYANLFMLKKVAKEEIYTNTSLDYLIIRLILSYL